jgi:hypothetical protein
MRYIKTLFLLLLLSSVVYSQVMTIGGAKARGIDPRKGKPPGVLDRDFSGSVAKKPINFQMPVNKSTVASYHIIDSMVNILGMWTDRGNPYDYNQTIDMFTFVHRGDRNTYSVGDTAGGMIYYNYSTDLGATWPRLGPANALDPMSPFGRYPSGSIFTPAGEDAQMFCAYPNLYGDPADNGTWTWGDAGAGGDNPIASGYIWSYRLYHDSSHIFGLGSALPCWTSSQTMFEASEIRHDNTNSAYTGTRFFRSQGTWTEPAVDPVPLDTFHVINCHSMFGGDAIKVGGVDKIAFGGIFYQIINKNLTNDDSTTFRYTIVVLYSTNQGLTWTADPDTIKFRGPVSYRGSITGWNEECNLPGLGVYTQPWEPFGSEFDPEGDLVLDKDGYPHIAIAVQQEDFQSQGTHAMLAEIYKDAGGWKAKIIGPLNTATDYTIYGSSSGHQTMVHPQIARNIEGTFFGVQYLNSNNANKNVDIFGTGRYMNALMWKAPVQFTKTDYSENAATGCSRLYRNGDSLFTYFSAFPQVTDLVDPTAANNRTYIMTAGVQMDLTAASFDYSAYSILKPQPGYAITKDSTINVIKASFKNQGELAQTSPFNVKFRILDKYGSELYSNQQPVGHGLALNEEVEVTFAGTFTPPGPGAYELQAIVLVTDQAPSNDTLRSTLDVYVPAPITHTLVVKKHQPYVELTSKTVMPLALDDSSYSYKLPFPLVFDGVRYDSCTTSINGWNELGKTDTSNPSLRLHRHETRSTGGYDNSDYFVSTSYPNKAFAAWWDDMTMQPYTGETDSGEISYKYDISTPDTQFIIQYKNIAAYFYTNSRDTRLNFQIKLHKNNLMEYHYGPVRKGHMVESPSGTPHMGASIGFKDTSGQDYHFFDIWKNSTGNRFYPNTKLSPLTDWPGPDSLIQFVPGGALPIVQLSARWNLISCPVGRDSFGGNDIKKLFPTSVDNSTWRYTGGYISTSTLPAGTGFWTKFPPTPASQSQMIIGRRIESLDITVVRGWNLIGSVDHTIPAPSGGIISGAIFLYSGGYNIATSLAPGKGFWLKANAAGTITLGGEASPKAPSEYDKYTTVTITDHAGNSTTLYVTQQEKNMSLEKYEMPPVPSPGMFDARFTSDRVLEAYPEEFKDAITYPIVMQAAEYPIVVTWDVKNTNGKEISLVEDGKSATTYKLSEKGKVTIAKGGANTLALKVGAGISLPKEFALGQNYPNPFNPVTHVMVEVPKTAVVNVIVYDVLGRNVATLLSGEQTAGYHLVEWNGENAHGVSVSSGMYFIRMMSDQFTAIRKVMLMK